MNCLCKLISSLKIIQPKQLESYYFGASLVAADKDILSIVVNDHEKWKLGIQKKAFKRSFTTALN